MTGDRLASSGPEPFDACPDGGRCWHACPGATKDGAKGMPCWRVLHALPLSSLGANWTQRDRDTHRRAAGVDQPPEEDRPAWVLTDSEEERLLIVMARVKADAYEAGRASRDTAVREAEARALHSAADALYTNGRPVWWPEAVAWLRTRADRLSGGDQS